MVLGKDYQIYEQLTKFQKNERMREKKCCISALSELSLAQY
jgi:hypothetical protein